MRIRHSLVQGAVVVGVLALAAAPSFARPRRNLPGFSTNTLQANDDGSTGLVPVGFNGNFFGTMFSSVYVNNNGNITFTAPLSEYTPFGLVGANTRIIAPFFADVDTTGTGSGLVHYGMATVNGHNAFGVEWPLVGYFGGHTDKLNSFELVLIDRSDTGAGNFDIELNYDQMKWETGDASGGVNGFGGACARAGYSNGTNANTFELPGSAVCGALLDTGANALIRASDSVTFFQVRNGTVVPPSTSSLGAACVFAPMSLPPLGTTTTPAAASITVLAGTTVTALCGVAGGNPAYTWTYPGLPNWLSPSGTSGTNISLTGIAPVPGPLVYNFSATVTDSSNPTRSLTVPLTVNVIPPLMISCNPANGSTTTGSAYSIACSETGGVGPFSWSYGGLPGWLSASGNTGTNISLSGIAPATPPNSYTFTVTLRDNASEQVTQTVTVTVGKGGGGGPTLLLLSCNPSTATVNAGVQFSASCSVQGGTSPYNIVPTNVPGWLTASVNAVGVTFSGTVPAPPPASYTVGVVVTDASTPTRTQSQSIAITVNGGPLSVSCSPGSVSVAAGQAFSVGCAASGGTAPFTWTYSGFPAGATGPSSGASVTVGGTMPPPPPNSFTGVVTVTDSSSPTKKSASQSVSITNTTTILSANCSGPSSAAAGSTYTATCTASGGTPGYTWTFAAPSFLTPSGNSGPTITLSGTVPSPPPTSYTISGTVTDSTKPTAQNASSGLTFTNTTPVLTISCNGPSTVAIGATYSATCTASGGTPGFTWSYSGLPPWLTGGTSGQTITLTGTAAAPAGPVSVVVTSMDSGTPTKQTATQTVNFTVNPPPLTLTCNPSTATVVAGTRFSSTCTSAGGTQAYNYTFTNGGLPSWLTASGTTGPSITLSGTPPNPPPASYSFTVVSTDSTSPTKLTASQAISITVQPGTPPGLTVSTTTAGVSANNANVVVSIGSGAAVALSGSVTLSFKADATVSGLPANYDGSSGVCESGAGFAAGPAVSGPCNTISTFNLAAGATSVTLQFSVGTVAGTWTATLTALNSGATSVLPTPAPASTFPVPAAAPVLTSVSLANKTNSSFDVVVVGVSSRRSLASGSFTFTGTDLTGTTFTVTLSPADQGYFNSPTGYSAGGAFLFRLTFPYSGDPTAVTGVSVTVTDGQGQTSAAKSGS
jgi:hypothetical protein